MKAWQHGRAFAASLLLAAALGAQAAKPVLPASAFVVPQACHVDPYEDVSLEQREQSLARDCGRDQLRLSVDGPRVQGLGATAIAPVKVSADQVITRSEGLLTSTLRLGWEALQGNPEERLETDHALVAVGGKLRLTPGLALDVNVGRDVGADLPMRRTFSGSWRATSDQLLFAEVSPEPAGYASAVGVRWWLVPKRLVLDLAARRSADGSELQPQLGLSLLNFGK